MLLHKNIPAHRMEPGGAGIFCAKQLRQSFLPLLKLEPVGDHGDELAVGGLAFGVGDGVAEILLALAAQCLQRILYSKNSS